MVLHDGVILLNFDVDYSQTCMERPPDERVSCDGSETAFLHERRISFLLLVTAVLFDIVKYTSHDTSPALKDHLLVAFRAVSRCKVHYTSFSLPLLIFDILALEARIPVLILGSLLIYGGGSTVPSSK